ncbi:hypothetical protein RBS60_10980 [Sinomonas sp. ASV486]|uniref:hypothetical protein n=1 Tax=Sinomonas sp. ASV486 TaxID=3051170 RepID=UPI0027DBB436|nr:hypothetical protein [Sinomonas sp. ASV486]MDQ4490721.1 hypothetical protein [Sinomonas sp. ASV486]
MTPSEALQLVLDLAAAFDRDDLPSVRLLLAARSRDELAFVLLSAVQVAMKVSLDLAEEPVGPMGPMLAAVEVLREAME